jgi:hypothetical protein
MSEHGKFVFARSSCPPITAEEATALSTSELLMKLTAACRYDKWQRPLPLQEGPTKVHAKVHVYFLGAIEAQSLVGQTVKVQHLSISNNTKFADM